LGMALVSWLNPSIRLLEDQLPDYEEEKILLKGTPS